MSPANFTVNPGTIQKASEGMAESAQDLVTKTQSLLGEVSDVSALGTNDTLGSLASMLYSAVLERVQETVDSVAQEYGGNADNLAQAAQAYNAVETDAVQSSGRRVTPA